MVGLHLPIDGDDRGVSGGISDNGTARIQVFFLDHVYFYAAGYLVC